MGPPLIRAAGGRKDIVFEAASEDDYIHIDVVVSIGLAAKDAETDRQTRDH